MGQKKVKKQPTSRKRQHEIQHDYGQPLAVNLTDRALRRLLILAETSPIDSVLSDAVMLLWQQRYPIAFPGSSGSSADAADAAGTTIEDGLNSAEQVDGDKRDKARELHARGMYIEDIAAELDWSTDTVEAALLGIDQSPPMLPVMDSSTLKEQVKTFREEGMSFTAIAQKLNDTGVPTLTGSGKWYHTSVKRLLRF